MPPPSAVLPPIYGAAKPQNPTRTYGGGPVTTSPRASPRSGRRPAPPSEAESAVREAGWVGDMHAPSLFSTFAKTRPDTYSGSIAQVDPRQLGGKKQPGLKLLPRTNAVPAHVPFAIGHGEQVVGAAAMAAGQAVIAVSGVSAPELQNGVQKLAADKRDADVGSTFGPRLQFDLHPISGSDGYFKVRAMPLLGDTTEASADEQLYWTLVAAPENYEDVGGEASEKKGAPAEDSKTPGLVIAESPVDRLKAGEEYCVVPRHATQMAVAPPARGADDDTTTTTTTVSLASKTTETRWRCTAIPGQKDLFAFEPSASSGVSLTCRSATDAGEEADDGGVRRPVAVASSDQDDTRQRWKVTPTAEAGYFTVADAVDGGLLTCRDGGSVSATEVVTLHGETGGAQHQQFTFYPVVSSSPPPTTKKASSGSKKGTSAAGTSQRGSPRSSSQRKPSSPRQPAKPQQGENKKRKPARSAGVLKGTSSITLQPAAAAAGDEQLWGLHPTPALDPDGRRQYLLTPKTYSKMFVGFAPPANEGPTDPDASTTKQDPNDMNAPPVVGLCLQRRGAGDSGSTAYTLIRSKAAVVASFANRDNLKRPAPPPPTAGVLKVGRELHRGGEGVTSADGKTVLRLAQASGTLQLVRLKKKAAAKKQKAATETEEETAHNESDDADAEPDAEDESIVWEAPAGEEAAEKAILGKDGVLRATSEDGAIVWQSPMPAESKVAGATVEGLVGNDGSVALQAKRPRKPTIDLWRASAADDEEGGAGASSRQQKAASSENDSPAAANPQEAAPDEEEDGGYTDEDDEYASDDHHTDEDDGGGAAASTNESKKEGSSPEKARRSPTPTEPNTDAEKNTEAKEEKTSLPDDEKSNPSENDAESEAKEAPAKPSARGDHPWLERGEALLPGDALPSPDGKLELAFVVVGDGNSTLVLRETADPAIVHWSSPNSAKGERLELNQRGRLELLSGTGTPVWTADNAADAADTQCFALRDATCEAALLANARPNVDRPAADEIVWSTRDDQDARVATFSSSLLQPEEGATDAGDKDTIVRLCMHDWGNRVLTVEGAATKAGTKVQLEVNQEDDSQKWVAKPCGGEGGWWTFEPMHVGGAALACKGLDMPLIISAAKENQPLQQWRFVKGTNGRIALENHGLLATAAAEREGGDDAAAGPIGVFCRRSCGLQPPPLSSWGTSRIVITETLVTTTEESGSTVIVHVGDDKGALRVDPKTGLITLVQDNADGTVFNVLDCDDFVALEVDGTWLTCAEKIEGGEMQMAAPGVEGDEPMAGRQQWAVEYDDDATYFAPKGAPACVMDINFTEDSITVQEKDPDSATQRFYLTVVDAENVTTKTDKKYSVTTE